MERMRALEAVDVRIDQRTVQIVRSRTHSPKPNNLCYISCARSLLPKHLSHAQMAVQTQALNQVVYPRWRNAEPAPGPSLRFPAAYEKPWVHTDSNHFAGAWDWRDHRRV